MDNLIIQPETTGPVEIGGRLELPSHLRISSPTPLDYGIVNPKFQEFIRPQYDAIDYGCSLSRPNIGMCLPTGIGKSLTAMAIAKYFAREFFWRTLILTHTINLQDQYDRDFASSGLKVIKGQSNYPCPGHGNCEDGHIYGCEIGSTLSCPHTAAKNEALISHIVLANYSYQLTVNRYLGQQSPIGAFQLLILDEAHAAPKLLSSHLQVQLEPAVMNPKFPDDINTMLRAEFPDLHPSPKPRQHLNQERIDQNVVAMSNWANNKSRFFSQYLSQLQTRLDSYNNSGERPDKSFIAEHKAAQKFAGDLSLLRTMAEREWVVDSPHKDMRKDKPHIITSTPISVAKHSRFLFGTTSTRIFMSATLHKKTIYSFGIADDAMSFREWARVFPAERNPVFAIPALNIKYDTEESQLIQDQLVKYFTMIGNFHTIHKGAIHSVSYYRMHQFVNLLRRAGLGDRLTYHEKDRYGRYESAAKVMARHADAPFPSIIISPSISTGVDLPDDLCRFCIIPKIPFPPSQDLVTKVRKQLDESLYNYDTIIDLTQMTGRGSRSYYDWCVYYLLDLAWHRWFERAIWNLRPISMVVNTVQEMPKNPLAFLEKKFW